MKNLITFILLILFIWACKSNVVESPDPSIKLKTGEKAQIPNTTVWIKVNNLFNNLCPPKDVRCVRWGEAFVSFQLVSEKSTSIEQGICIGDCWITQVTVPYTKDSTLINFEGRDYNIKFFSISYEASPTVSLIVKSK